MGPPETHQPWGYPAITEALQQGNQQQSAVVKFFGWSWLSSGAQMVLSVLWSLYIYIYISILPCIPIAKSLFALLIFADHKWALNDHCVVSNESSQGRWIFRARPGPMLIHDVQVPLGFLPRIDFHVPVRQRGIALHVGYPLFWCYWWGPAQCLPAVTLPVKCCGSTDMLHRAGSTVRAGILAWR